MIQKTLIKNPNDSYHVRTVIRKTGQGKEPVQSILDKSNYFRHLSSWVGPFWKVDFVVLSLPFKLNQENLNAF